MHQAFGPYGVKFFALNSPAFGENAATLAAFQEQAGLTYPVIADQDTEFSFQFSGTNGFPYPRDVVVDGNGIVRHASTDYNGQALRNLIIELLAEQGVTYP